MSLNAKTFFSYLFHGRNSPYYQDNASESTRPYHFAVKDLRRFDLDEMRKNLERPVHQRVQWWTNNRVVVNEYIDINFNPIENLVQKWKSVQTTMRNTAIGAALLSTAVVFYSSRMQ